MFDQAEIERRKKGKVMRVTLPFHGNKNLFVTSETYALGFFITMAS